MPGLVHSTIQKIIKARANGNDTLEKITVTKLLLKGIDATKWGPSSPDDADILDKLRKTAVELGVAV